MRTHGNKTFPGAVSFNHFDGYPLAISFSVSKSRCAQPLLNGLLKRSPRHPVITGKRD
jgi:hypothetical protein